MPLAVPGIVRYAHGNIFIRIAAVRCAYAHELKAGQIFNAERHFCLDLGIAFDYRRLPKHHVMTAELRLFRHKLQGYVPPFALILIG